MKLLEERVGTFFPGERNMSEQKKATWYLGRNSPGQDTLRAPRPPENLLEQLGLQYITTLQPHPITKYHPNLLRTFHCELYLKYHTNYLEIQSQQSPHSCGPYHHKFYFVMIACYEPSTKKFIMLVRKYMIDPSATTPYWYNISETI